MAEALMDFVPAASVVRLWACMIVPPEWVMNSQPPATRILRLRRAALNDADHRSSDFHASADGALERAVMRRWCLAMTTGNGAGSDGWRSDGCKPDRQHITSGGTS